MRRSGGWRTQGAAIIAAAVVLASPARAGCNPSDIFNAAKETVSGLSACDSACSNEGSCAAAIYMIEVLTFLGAGGAQDKVISFCSQVQGSASQIVGELQTVGGSSIGKELLGEVASELESVGSVADVVTCACETEQGGGALDSDLSSCMEDILCGAPEWLGGGSCDCTPPQPTIANCGAIDVKKCQAEGDPITQSHDPACVVPGSIGATCPNPPCWDPYAAWDGTLLVLTTSSGTYVSTVPAWAEGECNPGQQSCFCPAPRKADWLPVQTPEGVRYVFACDCPDGTHPSGATKPNGISSCLCDGTNQPANLGFAPFGMCPPPACPAGQTRLSPDSPCVTPCSDPKQGMAFDGSCCDPAQMTTCGKCCPPTTLPDPNSGTCVPRPQPPK